MLVSYHLDTLNDSVEERCTERCPAPDPQPQAPDLLPQPLGFGTSGPANACPGGASGSDSQGELRRGLRWGPRMHLRQGESWHQFVAAE